MKNISILIIPAEGDSVETESWYAKDVSYHYGTSQVQIFQYNGNKSIIDGIRESVADFFDQHEGKFEIHAQGGFGAAVAYEMALYRPSQIARIFFIGGAPCTAMRFIQRVFHTHLSRLWYFSKIPFFADDPNPNNNEVIAAIKKSSTACMRADPLLYCNQLRLIGEWKPKKCLEDIEAYFIPNGDSPRPDWWDNSYDNKKAAQIWESYGVKPLPKPGGGFSFYSLMPSEELFKVLDTVRDNHCN